MIRREFGVFVIAGLCQLFPWLERCLPDYVTEREHSLEPGETETGTMKVRYDGEQLAIISSDDDSDKEVLT